MTRTVDSNDEVVRSRKSLGATLLFASVSRRCISRSRADATSPGLFVAHPRASKRAVASVVPPNWRRRVWRTRWSADWIGRLCGSAWAVAGASRVSAVRILGMELTTCSMAIR